MSIDTTEVNQQSSVSQATSIDNIKDRPTVTNVTTSNAITHGKCVAKELPAQHGINAQPTPVEPTPAPTPTLAPIRVQGVPTPKQMGTPSPLKSNIDAHVVKSEDILTGNKLLTREHIRQEVLNYPKRSWAQALNNMPVPQWCPAGESC
jgi:hypothetical protein